MSESNPFPEELILQRDLDALPIHNIDDLPASAAPCGSQWKSPIEGGFRIGKIIIVDGAPEIRWTRARVVTLEGMAADLAEMQRLLDRKDRNLRDADKLYVGVNQILTASGIPEGPLAYRLEVALKERRVEAKQINDLLLAAGIPNGPLAYQVECAIARLRAADLLGDQAEAQRKVIDLRRAAAERDGLRAELVEVKSRAAAAMEEAKALREAIGPGRVTVQAEDGGTLAELAALRAERSMAIEHLGQLGESREFVDVIKSASERLHNYRVSMEHLAEVADCALPDLADRVGELAQTETALAAAEAELRSLTAALDDELSPLDGLMLGVECGKTKTREERLADIRDEARKMREQLDALGNPGRLSDVLAHRLAKAAEERQRLLEALDSQARDRASMQAKLDALGEAPTVRDGWIREFFANATGSQVRMPGEPKPNLDAEVLAADLVRAQAERDKARAEADSLAGIAAWIDKAAARGDDESREDALQRLVDRWRSEVESAESRARTAQSFAESAVKDSNASARELAQVREAWRTQVGALQSELDRLTEESGKRRAEEAVHMQEHLGRALGLEHPRSCDIDEMMRRITSASREADRLQKVIATCSELLGEAGILCDDGDLEAQLRSYIADTTQQEMAVVEAAASVGIDIADPDDGARAMAARITSFEETGGDRDRLGSTIASLEADVAALSHDLESIAGAIGHEGIIDVAPAVTAFIANLDRARHSYRRKADEATRKAEALREELDTIGSLISEAIGERDDLDASAMVRRLVERASADGEAFRDGRAQGQGDIAAKLRELIDPEDKERLNLDGLLAAIAAKGPRSAASRIGSAIVKMATAYGAGDARIETYASFLARDAECIAADAKAGRLKPHGRVVILHGEPAMPGMIERLVELATGAECRSQTFRENADDSTEKILAARLGAIHSVLQPLYEHFEEADEADMAILAAAEVAHARRFIESARLVVEYRPDEPQASWSEALAQVLALKQELGKAEEARRIVEVIEAQFAGLNLEDDAPLADSEDAAPVGEGVVAMVVSMIGLFLEMRDTIRRTRDVLAPHAVAVRERDLHEMAQHVVFRSLGLADAVARRSWGCR